MTPQCSNCRFWKNERHANESDQDVVDGNSFGWCRRYPKQFVDQMARQSIPAVGFGGNNFDPEDVATVTNVYNSVLYPASHGTEWCGEFEGVAA